MTEYVYIARQPKGHYIKIGVTTSLKRRMSELALDLVMAYEPYNGDARGVERAIHAGLADHRAPFGKEWFDPNDEVVAYLEEYLGMPVKVTL